MSRGSADFLNAEWLTTLSHELRSPLATIHGYATLLESYDNKLSAKERKEFLQLITEGSNRLVGLLDMLFAVAQFESGQVKLSVSSIDLVQFIQELLPPALQDDQSFIYDHTRFILREERGLLPASQPILLEADRSLLRQLLMHLLENAQKFSLEGSPIHVVVAVIDPQQLHTAGRFPVHMLAQLPAQEQAQPMIELQVQDYGVGIPVEYHERIFDRFQRVNVQLTREENGLGLGLALCKYIVSLHHGLIWVESMPGSGSIFHVLLPLHYQ